MWLSATFSESPARRPRSGTGRAAARFEGWRVVLAWAICLAATPAAAKVLVSPEQAVREAFPDSVVERGTSYLTDAQAAQVASLAGSAPSSRIVISWRAAKDGRETGVAYLESHLVRALPETILVVLEPDGKVRKVEILSFDEPPEYMPRERWLGQFEGRKLDDELSLRSGIRGVTGATLSSRAITSAVRRVLAAHQVLRAEAPASSPSPRPGAGAGASQPSSKPKDGGGPDRSP